MRRGKRNQSKCPPTVHTATVPADTGFKAMVDTVSGRQAAGETRDELSTFDQGAENMGRNDMLMAAIRHGLAALAALSPMLSHAAVINVHGGEVAILANQRCSLYEAIINAEADARVHADCAAGNGADILRLAPDGDYLVILASTPGSDTALPLITSEITIDGRGSTIRRSDHGSVAPMRAMASLDARLTLRNITFRDWRFTTSFAFDGGAVLWQRGGSLIVENARFLDNGVTPNGRGGAFHISASGAMSASAQATFTDCVFERNFVDSVTGQSGTGGGALMMDHGRLEIDRCAFIGNRTAQGPSPQAGVGGALNLSDHGGLGTDPLVTVAVIDNTTFSGNRAGVAGAINLQSAQGYALSMQLANVTVAGNTAFGPVKGIGANAGAQSTGQITVAYSTSILHGNGDGASDQDCTTTGGIGRVFWDSFGANLLRQFGGCSPDPFGEDILADSAWEHISPDLVDHGHDLLPHSPLIDRVAFGQCQHGVSMDQRGRIRAGGPGQGGAHCDVGAVEFYGKTEDDIIFRDGFESD